MSEQLPFPLSWLQDAVWPELMAMTHSKRKSRKIMRQISGIRAMRAFALAYGMGEVRINDRILNDPRMLRLASKPNARLLFLESYIWADREASGGLIDDVVIPSLCRGFEPEQQAAVDALVAVGFWVRRNTGYYIVGYIESGKLSRPERLAKEQKVKDERSKAGKAGADARWGPDGKPMANGHSADGKSSSEMANGSQPIYGNGTAGLPENEAAPLLDEEF